MIEGTVNEWLEAAITLTVGGAPGSESRVDAVIDTGYSGQLTLPSREITGLGLQRVGVSRATLADGSRVDFNVYNATVHWSGGALDILVDEADAVPLVGMDLLHGHRLQIDVESGGRVLIEPAAA